MKCCCWMKSCLIGRFSISCYLYFSKSFPLKVHRSPVPSGAPSKLSAGSVDGQLAIHALSDPKTSHRLTRYKPLVARARAGKFWEICWMQTGWIKEIRTKQADLFSFWVPFLKQLEVVTLLIGFKNYGTPQKWINKWWFPPYLGLRYDPLPMDHGDSSPPPSLASQVSRQGANS